MLDHKLSLVPAVAAALLTIGACAAESPDAQAAGICVDAVTEVRLEDHVCGDFDEHGHNHSTGTYFMWISTGSTNVVPAHGQKVPQTIGTRSVKPGTPIAKGVPSAGGQMSSITRGGFGVKAGSTSGIGGKSGASGGS